MKDKRISRLCELVREKPANNWTIKEMAKTAEMSESQFHKLFKSEKEMSPRAFLLEERLQKARELLENGYEQICQIGRQVGLHHESRFSGYFKTRFGKTPSAYRKNFLEKEHEKEDSDRN